MKLEKPTTNTELPRSLLGTDLERVKNLARRTTRSEGTGRESVADNLATVSGRLAQQIAGLIDTLKKDPYPKRTLKDLATLEKIRGYALRLHEASLVVHELSAEVRTGGAVKSGYSLSLTKKAIDSAAEEIKRIYKDLESFTVRSRFDNPNIKIKIPGLVAALGLAVSLSSDAPPVPRQQSPQLQTDKTAMLKKSVVGREAALHSDYEIKPGFGGTGEPGELERGETFAEIDFRGEITEKLWVNGYYTPHTHGNLRRVDSSAKTIDGRVLARVKLKAQKTRAGESIALPVPANYRAIDIKTDPFVTISFHENGREIYFNEASDTPVEISYSIVRAEETLAAPAAQKRSNTEPPEARQMLDKYLSDFLYITSSDINELFQSMPGSFEEKTGGIKIGDCDVLSMHAANLLNEVGIRSAVAVGFNEEEGRLQKGLRHAKLAIVTEEGNIHSLYESTQAVGGAFINLKLLSEDKAALEIIAQGAGNDPNKDQTDVRSRYYQQFRQKLDEILRKPEYEKYKSRETSFEERGLGLDFLKSLVEGFKKLLPTENAVIFALYFAFLLFSAIFPFIASKRIHKKIWGAQAAEIAALMKKMREKQRPIGRQMRRGINEPDIMGGISSFYKNYPQLDRIIPLKTVNSFSDREKQEYFGLLSMLPIFLGMRDDMLSVVELLFRNKFKTMQEHLFERGIDVPYMMRTMKEILEDKKRKEMALKAVPARAEAITKRALGYTAETIKPLERDGRITTARILQALGVEMDQEENIKRAHVRKGVAGGGGEFHEYKTYQPGDDLRKVDWKASARTGEDQLIVRVNEPEKPKTAESLRFRIIIDVNNIVDEYTLADLASILFINKRYPNTIEIPSITLVSYGKVVYSFDQRIMGTFAGSPDIQGVITHIIKKILALKIEHGLTPTVDRKSFSMARRVQDRMSGIVPDKLLEGSGAPLLMGFHPRPEYNTVDGTFRFKRRPDQGKS